MNLRQRKRAVYRAMGDTVAIKIRWVCSPEMKPAVMRALMNAPNILRNALRRPVVARSGPPIDARSNDPETSPSKRE